MGTVRVMRFPDLTTRMSRGVMEHWLFENGFGDEGAREIQSIPLSAASQTFPPLSTDNQQAFTPVTELLINTPCAVISPAPSASEYTKVKTADEPPPDPGVTETATGGVFTGGVEPPPLESARVVKDHVGEEADPALLMATSLQ
jgi:hypothetical protein